MKKKLAILLTLVLAFGAVGSLTGCNKKDPFNTFTYWIGVADGAREYGAYENNPGVQYMTAKEWEYEKTDAEGNTVEEKAKIGLEFIAPASASGAQDSFNSILGSGSPADIMELTYNKDSIVKLLSDNVAMDLTPYVEKYMPNYKKFISDNDLYNLATNVVNGERKYLQLWSYHKTLPESWLGYCYRRDWIVDYGKHPSTNQAFTGGYATYGDSESWSDNVVFPSFVNDTSDFITQYKLDNPDWQGSWPVTISDWEWMLGIFKTAITTENISGGYPMNIYKSGFINTGNLVSSFGGGGAEWYVNKDTGKVEFGATQSTFETYVNTMRSWYQSGWIDENFQKHNELFYQTDIKSTSSGKVGLWCGMSSDLLNNFDISKGNTNDLTYGMCVYGAPLPINDKYGNDENKYKEPYTFYEIGREITSIMVTTAAKNKNLPALFTMLDFLYTDEGAWIKGGGLDAQQVEECNNKFYKKNGFSDGFRTWDEELDGYRFTPKASSLTPDQQNAYKPVRLAGLELYTYYAEDGKKYDFTLGLWRKYVDSGRPTASFVSQLSSADSVAFKTIETDVRNVFSQDVPKFIKGEKNMGNDWAAFKLALTRLDVASVTTMFNSVLESI